MTREEATQWIENNFFGDLNEEDMVMNLNCMVDLIYKENENRTCENCKLMKAFDFCSYFNQCMSEPKTFGCNKFEKKEN